MPDKTSVYYWEKLRTGLDLKLLVFLLLFLDVKLAIKVPAIVLIYILQLDLKFGFSLKNSRLPLFYLIVIGIAVLNGLIQLPSENTNYALVWLTGIGFWLMCILAIHQIKLAVERNSVDMLQRTITVFFIINAVVSLINLLLIILKIHNINPYTYQGEYQKYFISTGDYIKGITFDTSDTNAILSAIGVIYFLDKKKPLLLLMCMGTLLLTCSNFINIVLLVILLVIFIFKSTRDQKSLIAACVFMLVIFMAKVSPQNNGYVTQTFAYVFFKERKPIAATPAIPIKKVDSVLTPDQRKQKKAQAYLDSVGAILTSTRKTEAVTANKPIITTASGRIIKPGKNINAVPYQSLTTTPGQEKPLADFVNAHKAELPISGKERFFFAVPGKLLGMEQTINFFREHPGKLLLGAGMGNFSSKLAFKATGLGISGGYPAAHIYINPAFMANDLDIYLNFFSRRPGFHSFINDPASVYDQMASEYGLLGFLALFIYYFGFFASQYQLLTYGIPLLFLMAVVFFTNYWFEQLSIVPFFELLLFLNIKETSALKAHKP